jgi:hypothetical protein
MIACREFTPLLDGDHVVIGCVIDRALDGRILAA